MAAIVYVLCTATALTCSVLLLRGYQRSGARLLFWSGLCFALFALENLVLFIDQIIIPTVDLSLFPLIAALVGVVFLLYGLIWETK